MSQGATKNVDNHALLAIYYSRPSNKNKITEKAIQELVKHGNINYKIPSKYPFRDTNAVLFGDTALHLAIKTKTYEDVKILIENGADYTIKNGNGETPLHLIIKEFYGTGRKFIELRESLDSMLSAHIKSQNHSNPRNKYGLSHFHAACIRGRTKLIKLFLKNGVLKDEAINRKSDVYPGYTPLHFAARFSCLSTAKLLLKLGVDLNCNDFNNRTPLEMLIHRNLKIADWMNMGKSDSYDNLKMEYERNEKIIIMIMEKMAHDRNEIDSKLSILHVACTLQDTSKLEHELHKDNVDVEQPFKENSSRWPGYTPLHFAALFNSKSVELLIKAGGNFFKKNPKELMPLDLCLQRYEVQNLCSFLNLKPVSKTIRFAKYGISLLSALSAMRNEKTFEKFLKSLDDINMFIEKNSPIFSKYTLLHLAVTLAERNQDKIDKRSFYEPDSNAIQTNCSKEQEEIYLRRIKMCLELGANVTAINSKGSTPLHLAFKLQKESAVNFLLESYDCKVDLIDEDNLCHLHIACAVGKKSVVEQLLSNSTEHLNRAVTTNYNYRTICKVVQAEFEIVSGSTPLHIAVMCRNTEVIKILVDHNADISARDSSGLTPIHQIFTLNSRSQVIDVRLKEIANILLASDDLKDCETSFGLSHLHVASFVNNVTAIEKLLANVTNIDVAISMNKPVYRKQNFLKDLKGYTPLHLALKYDCKDAAVNLIRYSAKIVPVPRKVADNLRIKLSDFIATNIIHELAFREDFQNFGLTKLHAACASLNVEQVRELLDGGADPNAQISKNSPIWPGDTPLHFVVIKRDDYPMNNILQIIDLLLSYGVNVALANFEKDTAIHRSMNVMVDSRNAFLFPHSLFRHVDFKINPSDKQGMSHFHIVCFFNNIDLVEEYLRNGAVDVNQKIGFGARYWAGNTPLHIAAQYKCYNVVKLLLTYGADVHKRNGHYRLPIHEAALSLSRNVNDHQTDLIVLKLAKTENNVNSMTLENETPLEFLLSTSRSTTNTFRLFLEDKNRRNFFNPTHGGGYIAMAISHDRNVEEFLQNTYFAAVIDAPEENGPDEMGRTPIHNIVSLPPRDPRTHPMPLAPTDVYIEALEQMIQVGFDIDHQDSRGQTALHAAAQCQNVRGFEALVTLGADINITDNDERTPLFYISEWFEKPNIKETQKEILKIALDQIYKMQFIEINVSDINIDHETTLRKHLNELNETTKENWQVEKDNLMNENVDSRKWRLWSFLSETGAVRLYPKMMPSEREAIDNFFQTNTSQLLQDYPHFSGLLMLQHRKAQVRINLIKLARNSLHGLFDYRLPDICCDCILEYLSNEHLKKLTLE